MNSISNKSNDITYVLNTISERMLETRSEKQLKFYSFTPFDAVSYERQSFINIDFSKVCGSFTDGSIGVAKTYLKRPEASDGRMVIAISGCCSAYLNGICAATNLSEELNIYPITLNKGLNELVLRVCAANNSFKCRFIVCIDRYIGLWPNDYLFYTKPVT